MHLHKPNKLRNKLILCTSISIAVYVIVFLLFFSFILPMQFNRSQENLNNNLVSTTNEELSSLFLSAHNLYLSIINNEELTETIADIQKEKSTSDIYSPSFEYGKKLSDSKTILEYIVNYNSNSIKDIAVTCGSSIITSTAELPSPEENEALYKYNNRISFFNVSHVDKISNKSEMNYVISFPFNIFPDKRGNICLFLNIPEYIFSDSNSIIYLFDDNGCIFTNNQLFNDVSEAKKHYDTWQLMSEPLSEEINGKNFCITSKKIDLYNWKLVSLMENDNFYATSHKLTGFMVIALSLSIIFMICLSVAFSNIISQSITNISHEIDTFIEQLDNNILIQKKQLYKSHLYIFLSRFTLKKKLWIYFFIVVLLPVMITFTITYTQTTSLINSEFRAKSATLSDNIQSSIIFTLNEYNNSLSNIVMDRNMQNGENVSIPQALYNYSKLKESSEKNSQHLKISEQIFDSSHIWNNAVFSYFNHDKLIMTVPSSKSFENDDFYKTINKNFMTKVTWNVLTQSYNIHFIKSILLTSSDYNGNIGYCSVSFSPEVLNRLFDAVSNEFSFFLSDENGTIFSSNTPQTAGVSIDSKLESYDSSLILKTQLSSYPLYLTIALSTDDMHTANTALLIFILISTAFIIAVVAIIINIFNNHIIYHVSYVNMLLNTDNELPKHKTHDELDLLTVSVENMKIKLSDLINQVYKHKIFETELQLKAMHAQITPHFLYNTLEIISSLIQINDKRAVDLTLLLADFFRQGISSEQNLITLEQELSYTNVYLDIHRVILGDKLKVYTKVSDSVKQNIIVKFSLQPLVENSLNHGNYLPSDTRIIKINTYNTSDFIKISVRDNGKGMSEDILEQVRASLYSSSEEKKNEKKHIGLKNVHERIKLHFGEDYGLKVYSIPEKGTLVVLKIPCRTSLGNEVTDGIYK